MWVWLHLAARAQASSPPAADAARLADAVVVASVGALRAALANATVIEIEVDGASSPYVFADQDNTSGASGPTALSVERSVTIRAAPGSGEVVLDAGGSAAAPRRVVTVSGAGVVVALSGLVLTGGYSHRWGGGLRVEAGSAAVLEGCRVEGNVVNATTGNAVGGGVDVMGNLTARRTPIVGNVAVSDEGFAQGGGLHGGVGLALAMAMEGGGVLLWARHG